MIFITGDTHSEMHRFSMKSFPEQKSLTKEDFLIVCGDFGCVWEKTESRQEYNILNELEKRSFTTLFVDGNHENHERLNAMPVEIWRGGKVHRVRESVIHLMRGQVYDIDGIKLFTFGGAQSNDIADGIFDPDAYGGAESRSCRDELRLWRRKGKQFRIKGKTWWAEELPSEAEIAEARQNLMKAGKSVDYIITHCLPASTVNFAGLCGIVQNDQFMDYLEELKIKVHYRKWFAGHYHVNLNIPADKTIILYEQIIRIV